MIELDQEDDYYIIRLNEESFSNHIYLTKEELRQLYHKLLVEFAVE